MCGVNRKVKRMASGWARRQTNGVDLEEGNKKEPTDGDKLLAHKAALLVDNH